MSCVLFSAKFLLAVYSNHAAKIISLSSAACSWSFCYSGSRTLRHRDTSAPQNWCRNLRRITGGAVSELSWVEVSRLFPRSRHSCRSVSYRVFGVEVSWDWCRSVPECFDAEVNVAELSGNRYSSCWMGLRWCRALNLKEIYHSLFLSFIKLVIK